MVARPRPCRDRLRHVPGTGLAIVVGAAATSVSIARRRPSFACQDVCSRVPSAKRAVGTEPTLVGCRRPCALVALHAQVPSAPPVKTTTGQRFARFRDYWEAAVIAAKGDDPEAAVWNDLDGCRAPSREDQQLEQFKLEQEKLRRRVEAKKQGSPVQTLVRRGSRPHPELRGWRLVLLRHSAQWFYHNEDTGEFSKEPPPGAPAVAVGPPEPNHRLQVVLLLDTGVWYYYDEERAYASWEAPEGIRPMIACPAHPPHPWRLVLHASSGEWCYRNEDTGATSWELPPELDSQAHRDHDILDV